MKPTEIIKANAQQQGVQPESVIAGVGRAIQEKKSFLMQENNSVLVSTMIAPGTVEAHLFTMDSPMVLVKSIAGFLEQFKQARFVHTIYVGSSNQQIGRLLQLAGCNPQHSDKPGYDWMIRI
jgi:hypothetical protein